MKSYKLLAAAAFTVGLLLISSGVVLAQGQQGNGSGDCNGTGTCQMAGQGSRQHQGPGNGQGQGSDSENGRANRQSESQRQGKGDRIHAHQGQGHQGQGHQGQGHQGQGHQGQGHQGQGNGVSSRQGGNQQGDQRRGQGAHASNWATVLPPKIEGNVPAAVVAAMQAGIADEQHALAVYAAILDQFGNVRPFNNILRSEAQHIAAWEFLFERYGIDVPAAPKVEVPEFTSLVDACQAAADAEVANRDLYDQMLATLAAYPDMTQVATQLRTVSDQHHLPAFERCAQ